jgi:hypothetical protein
VVKGYELHELEGKAPRAQKEATDFGVRRAPELCLDHMHRIATSFDSLRNLGSAVGGVACEHQKADIVEQGGRHRLLGPFGVLYEAARHACDLRAVIREPRDQRATSRRRRVLVREDLSAHDERSEQLDAEVRDGASNRTVLLARAKERGARELQYFGAQRRVLFDERGELSHADVRALHRACQLEVSFGQ